MIFLDTNVLMFAVGRDHPLKAPARALLRDAVAGPPLVTSAEVLQELLHAYGPVDRLDTFDDALALVDGLGVVVWDLTDADVRMARALAATHPTLTARDLIHLAACRRRGATDLATFDRGLKAAWGSGR